MPQPLPDWWQGDDRPLVYVSFGTVAATFPPAAQVYARSLEAVAELPVRVLLTTGGNDLELGDLPANVHVEGGSTRVRSSLMHLRSSATEAREQP